MNRKFLLTFSILGLCLMPFMAKGGPHQAEKAAAEKSVVFIHGGAIDDFVSYLLLTTMDGVHLKAVVLTNTDCVAPFSMQTQWKLQNMVQDMDLPVGLSTARGWNAFPWLYRKDSVRMSEINSLKGLEDNTGWPPFPSGDAILEKALSTAVEDGVPVTVLVTCPITPLSNLLKKRPDLEKGIEKVIWMAGAVNVEGNLDKETLPKEIANPKAEWNVFWDPFGADWFFRNTRVPIVLFTLDVTDQIPLSRGVLDKLKEQAATFSYSAVIVDGYNLTRDEPFYEMWNTATTAYVALPDSFHKPTPTRLKVVTEGFDQGAFMKSPDGRLVQAVLDTADLTGFYNYILEQFRRNLPETASLPGKPGA